MERNTDGMYSVHPGKIWQEAREKDRDASRASGPLAVRKRKSRPCLRLVSTRALALTFLGRSVSSMSSLSESTAAALFLCFFVNCASGRLSSSEESWALATQVVRYKAGIKGTQLQCKATGNSSSARVLFPTGKHRKKSVKGDPVSPRFNGPPPIFWPAPIGALRLLPQILIAEITLSQETIRAP